MFSVPLSGSGGEGWSEEPFIFETDGFGPVPARIRGSAKLSHSSKVSDRRRDTPKSAQNLSESLCAGLWASCLGLVWPGFRPKSASKSKVSGRILKHFRGPCSSGEGDSIFCVVVVVLLCAKAGSRVQGVRLVNAGRHSPEDPP